MLDEFVVTIPQAEGPELRGRFRIKTKLSMAEVLGQDAMRRQLLGPAPDGAAAEAAVLAHAIAKIRTYVLETPSWWKENGEGLGFEDINAPVIVLNELEKALAANRAEAAKKSEVISQDLKAEVKK